MSDIADAVAGVTNDLFGGSDEAQPDEAVNSATDAAAPEAHDAAVSDDPELVLPSLEYDLPDEYKELLDEPDFEAEASEDVDDDDTEEFAVSEYDDEVTKQLKKQLLAEKKRADHYAQLRVKDNLKRWQAEADKVFKGFAGDLSDVKATSHRAFLREAKRRADTNQKVLAPHIQALNEARAKLVEASKLEGRSEAAAAWGKPTVGGGHVPDSQTPSPDADQRLERGRQRRSMVDVAKALIDKNVL